MKRQKLHFQVTVVFTTSNNTNLISYKITLKKLNVHEVCIIWHANCHHNIPDVFIMNLIILHREPDDDFILTNNVLSHY